MRKIVLILKLHVISMFNIEFCAKFAICINAISIWIS
jgi:hypothetical protein